MCWSGDLARILSMSTQDQSAQQAGPIKEVTLRAIILGILIGLVMGVANVYLGLYVGLTVSASIPAAVISMGLLRGVFKNGTILENNTVQTIASAGESLAAGIIFTMPALVIVGVWTEFDFWTVTLVSVTGGLLGVLFMIPLRKPMIVDDEELIYPEGVACAKVLTAGQEGGAGMRAIFIALGAGALIKVLADGYALMSGSLKFHFAAGKAHFFTGITAGPALIGVGYIVGINIAALVFVGGAIAWLVGGPAMTMMGYDGIDLADPELQGVLKTNMRYLGVGAMVVGGLWSIIMIRKGIAQGVRETMLSYRSSMGSSESIPRTEQDMDRRWILLLISATMMITLLLYNNITGSFGVSVLATGLMTVCSFFFVAVAAYIVGLVGSSNSPVSGMTICSVLLTSAFIAAFGFEGEIAIIATLGVAGVVCCATCTSGDVCQDLKTGSLLGATPYRQQWVEVIGVITASFVMWGALTLLHNGYGIGSDAHLPLERQGNALEAPQAQLFSQLMNGFFGDEALPWGLIAAGIGIGLVIILVDQLMLVPSKSKVRLHVMPVAVGMYLPFGLSAAIMIGGLLSWMAMRSRTASSAEKEAGQERGVLLASGLIAGEAIAGVMLAIPAAAEDTSVGKILNGLLVDVFDADVDSQETMMTVV
ncbi:MAG: putative OPT family oligopeptide transporter, partial [Planctomycetota bacterium]